MAQNLLLEIGLEEMPAHVVTPSMKQLQQKTAEFLTKKLQSMPMAIGQKQPKGSFVDKD